MKHHVHHSSLLTAGFCAVLLALSCFGLGTYFLRGYPARAELAAVEGRVVGDSISTGSGLRLRVEGYARQLSLVHPAAAAARVRARLRVGDCQRVRLLAKPWSNNAERATIAEFALLTADGEDVLFSYDEALNYRLNDNRAGLAVGSTFGLILLGVLLACALPARRPVGAVEGRVSRDIFPQRAAVLAQLLACLGLETLFVWGVGQVSREPGMVLAVPMAALFAGFSLSLLLELVRRAPTVSVNDSGVAILGGRRVPWGSIREVVGQTGSIQLRLVDAPAALREEGLRFRCRAWVLRKLSREPYSFNAAFLDAEPDEVLAILRSHLGGAAQDAVGSPLAG